MAGLVPAIHAFLRRNSKDVDARHKAGHDEKKGALTSTFLTQTKTAGGEPAVRKISKNRKRTNHTVAVIHCSSFCFGAAPT
jgi:hypothetical protein